MYLYRACRMPDTPPSNNERTPKIASVLDPRVETAGTRSVGPIGRRSNMVANVGRSAAYFPAESKFAHLSLSPTIVPTSLSTRSETDISAVFHPNTYFKASVICVSNIPWDITTRELREWFSQWPIADFGVHILMDRSLENAGRTTGKTISDAYIEFVHPEHAHQAVHFKHRTALKARLVSVRMASQEELFRRLYPLWPGAQKSSDEHQQQESNIGIKSQDAHKIYLKRDEIQAILMVCRNYKMHFSRKCADRPFENVVSIVAKIPWHISDACPTILHRDHIFELLKLSIEILCNHLKKNYYHVNDGVLEQLVRVGIKCAGFTERQKTVMLQVAGTSCPEDLMDDLAALSVLQSERPHLDAELVETDENALPAGYHELISSGGTLQTAHSSSFSASADGSSGECSFAAVTRRSSSVKTDESPSLFATPLLTPATNRSQDMTDFAEGLKAQVDALNREKAEMQVRYKAALIRIQQLEAEVMSLRTYGPSHT